MKRLLLIGVLMCCCSCAFMNERNRPLMTLCQENLFPKSTVGKVVTAPVTWPLTGAAAVVDTVVVHPVMSLRESWFDTGSTLWVNWDHGWAGESALMPLRLVGTPPVYVLTWVERSLLNIPNRPPSASRVARRVMDTDSKDRLAILTDVPPAYVFFQGGQVALGFSPFAYDAKEKLVVGDGLLKACKAYGDDGAFCEAAISKLPSPLTAEALAYLAGAAQGDNGRIAAAAMIRLVAEASMVPAGDQPDPALGKHVGEVANLLANVYDGLVASDRKQAEVTLAYLVARHPWYPGTQAVGLYIEHSLFKRGSPMYAESVSFFLQESLMSSTTVTWLNAVAEEWRVLHNDGRWGTLVQHWVGEIAAGKRAQLEQLIVDQKKEEKRVTEQLSKLGKGDAESLQGLTAKLLMLKTSIDAEAFAIRLMEGPASDRKIFFDAHPVETLQMQGSGKK